uniref:Uncharacterized protein n=1 Tax=Nelumbo nucifera TaxID=4432 RepID=A0A822YWC7_NELNU|nr:TPA_asm: hypothetical protein HUJ06_007104 [Nelumbo nucifera]
MDICDSTDLELPFCHYCFLDNGDFYPRLHLAAWSGQTEVVSYLCKHKADVGAAAMDDMGAIHFAAQKGHLEVVRVLLSSGVSIKASNRKGLTPLHYAVQGSHMELVKYLARKGASLSAKTKAGKTPIDLANTEEIRLFLAECEELSKKGKDLTEKGKAEQSTSKGSIKDEVVGSDSEAKAKHDNEDSKDKKEARNSEEAEIEENASKTKKPRIALNHLLATDDTEEENQ